MTDDVRTCNPRVTRHNLRSLVSLTTDLPVPIRGNDLDQAIRRRFRNVRAGTDGSGRFGSDDGRDGGRREDQPGLEFVQAEPGQAVNAGDRILVMEGGSASITYSDGCVLQISSGSLITVPATSTCKGAQLRTLQIAPSESGPVGTASGGSYSTVNTVGWIWMGTVAACAIFCESENNNNTVSP
jgi:hypothetical protein